LDGLTEADFEALELGLALTEGETLALLLGLILTDGLTDADAEGETLALLEGLTLTDGETEGDFEGEIDTLGLTEDDLEGEIDGEILGDVDLIWCIPSWVSTLINLSNLIKTSSFQDMRKYYQTPKDLCNNYCPILFNLSIKAP
jgi:hypothetical protein